MIAANVLSKEEFPDFDEETGILPKVDDEEGSSTPTCPCALGLWVGARSSIVGWLSHWSPVFPGYKKSQLLCWEKQFKLTVLVRYRLELATLGGAALKKAVHSTHPQEPSPRAARAVPPASGPGTGARSPSGAKHWPLFFFQLVVTLTCAHSHF